MQSLLTKLTNLMEMNEGELTPLMPLSDCGNWDSLTKVSLLGMLASDMRINITVEALENCKTTQDIHRLVTENLMTGNQ